MHARILSAVVFFGELCDHAHVLFVCRKWVSANETCVWQAVSMIGWCTPKKIVTYQLKHVLGGLQ